MQPGARTREATFVETSRTGALLVELDASGAVVRVQLEPEVTATWSADTLAERVCHLHRVALMRARLAQRRRMNDLGADMPPDDTYPSESEIDDYRARHLLF